MNEQLRKIDENYTIDEKTITDLVARSGKERKTTIKESLQSSAAQKDISSFGNIGFQCCVRKMRAEFLDV